MLQWLHGKRQQHKAYIQTKVGGYCHSVPAVQHRLSDTEALRPVRQLHLSRSVYVLVKINKFIISEFSDILWSLIGRFVTDCSVISGNLPTRLLVSSSGFLLQIGIFNYIDKWTLRKITNTQLQKRIRIRPLLKIKKLNVKNRVKNVISNKNSDSLF